jgi:hypothetical protein
MIVQLPIDGEKSPFFSFSTELDGVSYGFEFRWNTRSAQWVMSLFDGAGQPVAIGLRVVVNIPLLFRYRSLAGVPNGELVAIDTSGKNQDPTFSSFGVGVVIRYVSRSEIQ